MSDKVYEVDLQGEDSAYINLMQVYTQGSR